MSTSITDHLRQRFEERGQKVVIWHDQTGQYSDDLESLDICGATLLRVNNNEFGIKARILASDSSEKFLVYREGEIPHGTDNWLLDLELAYGIFTADRSSLLIEELGIQDPTLAPVLADHPAFFKSKNQTSALKKLISDLSQTSLVLDAALLQALMSQVVVKSPDHRLRSILRVVLSDYANDSLNSIKKLESNNLLSFFWSGIRSIYHYQDEEESVESLTLWLFQRAFEGFEGDYAQIQADFDWMTHDTRHQKIIRDLADRTFEDMELNSFVEAMSIDELANIDVFSQIDLALIEKLVDQIISKTIPAQKINSVHQQRQNTLWYDKSIHLYKAVENAATLLSLLPNVPINFDTPKDGFDYYSAAGYKIDQLYRHFLQEFDDIEEHSDLLEPLKEMVDREYVGSFLLRNSQRWQSKLNEMDRWLIPGIPSQSNFYSEFVEPRITGQKKLVVVISDALRYEFAQELAERFTSTDRYSTELHAMLGCLPSYTQLGMAALLPNNSLSLQDDGDVAFVDGKSTKGLENRSTILKSVDAQAVQAEKVMKLQKSELRSIITSSKVLYVYHNRIDATGDDAKTESRVLRDGDHALRELEQLIKRLTAANVNNLLVTADHGFLYQDTDLEDWAYASEKPEAMSVSYSSGRRYTLGHGFVPKDALTTFTADQLGLEGELEVQFPNGFQRFRKPGAGSRYVHGGPSLQEIVVPVVAINKGRQDDTRQVSVRLAPRTNTITTGQVLGEVFQEEAVGGKTLPRTVRVGVYGGDKLISTTKEFEINRTSETPRDRHYEFQLALTPESDDFNRAPNVAIILHTWVEKAKRWDVFASVDCTINRSFISDFDF